MKRIILIIQIIIMGTAVTFGQLSPVATYNADLKSFQMKDGTLKFVKVDLKKKALQVFDAENILENTVALNIPAGHKIKDVRLVSNTSEGKDSYDILYTCYYVAQQPIDDFADRFPNQNYTLNVVDTDGNYLLEIPNTTGFQLLKSGDNNKLLVYQTVRKGFKTKRFVEVYAL